MGPEVIDRVCVIKNRIIERGGQQAPLSAASCGAGHHCPFFAALQCPGRIPDHPKHPHTDEKRQVECCLIPNASKGVIGGDLARAQPRFAADPAVAVVFLGRSYGHPMSFLLGCP